MLNTIPMKGKKQEHSTPPRWLRTGVFYMPQEAIVSASPLIQPSAAMLAVHGVGIVLSMATCGARAGILLLRG